MTPSGIFRERLSHAKLVRLSARALVPALLCAALVAAAPAYAAVPPTFTASSTADVPDAHPGDGLCLTANGLCTLRAAVQEANAIGGATINLLAGATYTLTRLGPDEDAALTGDLDLTSTITITVPGGRAVVQGAFGWNDRIFQPVGIANVNLSALDIRGGAVSGQGSGGGGGIGIAANATLTLTNSTVSGNAARVGGGGIHNFGTLTLTDSTVSGNQAGFDGGGIFNQGSLTLTNSTVSGNSAATVFPSSGGGIYTHLGTLTLTNSTVSANSASYAGGIFAGGTVNVNQSTVSRNFAGFDGGGIDVTVGSRLVAVNSTISTNRAARNGGGFYNLGTAGLNNVTIADNVADSDGNGDGHGGGISNVAGGVVSLGSTIVGDNVDLSATSKFPDCVGSLTSAGYNLVENTSGCAISGPVTTGNITGRDPRLGPLQYNGGSTFTHALLLGDTKLGPSPAIDSGNPNPVILPNPLPAGLRCSVVSQNGVSRSVDGNADGVDRCDIGAYEVPQKAFPLGTWALTPATATAHVGDRVSYSLAWTVPAPGGWRSLDTLQLRFVDHRQSALWLRFQEVPGSPGLFSVVDPETGQAGRGFAPGSHTQLKGSAAKLYLAKTSVDGPPGSQVTLRLTISFKGRAAGHSYDVQVLATDDTGATQGFHRAGTVTVARGERDGPDSDSD